MANVKISELPVAASVDGASSFPVVEGGVTKQVTFTGMLASPSLFASGMATFFATPSSANLRAALTDETGTGAAVFADSPTLVGPTVGSGNVTFSGTAQRITGDFSNATLASRVMFQTSTANGATNLHAIPNGTGTVSSVQANNSSDAANGSQIYMAAGASVTQLASDKTGTGTYLPLTFYTGGSERVHVDTSGNVGIGTNAPDAKLDVTGPASVTSFTGSTRLGLTVQGSAAATDYSGIDFSGNNQVVPTARIAVLSESGGSILSFGTSNNYATGITNQALRLDFLGNLIASVNSSAPSLGTNSTMSFELTSNTSLKIVVRGSDGVTRSVSLTLA